jgi:AcrR family transcriptional regulator
MPSAVDRPAGGGQVRTLGGQPARERKLRTAGRRNVARLLDAALSVFAEHGYHAARVDDVCTLACVSHGTFYRYFASKEDVFRALLDDVVREMRELAGDLPQVDPGMAGREALRAWVGRFYDLYQRYLPVIQAWNEALPSDPDLARTGARVLRAFVARLGERVKEQNSAPVAHPEVAAVAMIAMLERATAYALGGIVRTDREVLLETLTEILHAGLFRQ